jgi:tetratricopeptide (TPR) repeat protein
MHFHRVIGIDPTHSFALYGIALCHTHCTKDLVTAAVYFEKSIASDPNNLNALYHYGLLLFRKSPNDPRAVAMLERAEALCDEPHQLQEIKAAIRRYRTVNMLFGSAAQVTTPPCESDNCGYSESIKLKDEGNQLFKRQDFEAAIAKYVRASVLLAQAGEGGGAHRRELQVSLNLNMAACFTARKAWDKVIVYCDKALELDKANAKAHYRRAIANEASGLLLVALDDIRSCHRCTRSNDPTVTAALSRIEQAASAVRSKISPPTDSRIPSTHQVLYGNDLVVGRVHRGRYLVGVIMEDAFRMTGIHFEIEDEYGYVIAMSLYVEESVQRLKKGKRICIVDPFYKRRMDGSLGIRVDNKDQVIML